MKIGRNDPCHCGSGKKYKRCCLGKDTEERLVARQVEDDFLDDAPDPYQARVLRQFEERSLEIELATKKLDAHRAEFERLADDEDKLVAQTESLFAEAPFTQLEFSRDEMQRAIQAVGRVDSDFDEAAAAESARKIMAELLADGKAEIFALRLLMLLPQYVSAKRYTDGMIILYNAVMIQQFPNAPPAPILALLCQRALNSLQSDQDQARNELFAQLGTTEDELRDMGPEKAEEWFRKMMSTPDATATLERFLEAHPEIMSIEPDEYVEPNEESIAFLNSDEGRILYFDSSELIPWIAEIGKRVGETPGLTAEIDRLSQSPSSSTDDNDRIWEVLLSVCRDMAATICTSERVEEMRHHLRTFRKTLDAKTEQRLGPGLDQALTAITTIVPPENNPFLIELCRASLIATMKSTDWESEIMAPPATADAERRAKRR